METHTTSHDTLMEWSNRKDELLAEQKKLARKKTSKKKKPTKGLLPVNASGLLVISRSARAKRINSNILPLV